MPLGRIVICASQIPFIHGGAEVLVSCLQRELSKHGWVTDVVRLPFQFYPAAEAIKGYVAWRMLDLETSRDETIDLVISTKYPTFAVRHPRKVTWLIHQMRRVYDLYGLEYSPYGHCPEDYKFRRIIQQADTRALSESRRLFAISQTVAKRLAYFNQLQAQILYPPPKHEGLYYHEKYGEYVLVVSRLNRLKRVDLIIEAMKWVHTGVSCLIAGTGDYEEDLKRLAQRCGVGKRVQFLGYVDEDHLLSLYANAMAVFYAPYDEDYGYATVEAFKSRKPVLTTTDSGGVREFVTDGETGCVVPPDDVQALADRLDRLFVDRPLCRRMGEAGYEVVRFITWDRTIQQLTAEIGS